MRSDCSGISLSVRISAGAFRARKGFNFSRKEHFQELYLQLLVCCRLRKDSQF